MPEEHNDKRAIKQKLITTGFGMALILLCSASIFAFGSLTGLKPVANGSNPMLVVAIANSFATVLLGWIYSRLWHLFANSQTSEQALPLLDKRGEIYQILSITHDITEQKQAEEALQQINQELVQEGCYAQGRGQKEYCWYSKLLNLFQLDTRHTALELAIGQHMTQLRQVYEDLLTEVTERKRMEEALKSSEERFRVALQNSPTVVFNQDTELRYTWFYDSNPQSDAERVIGKLEAELLLEEDAERLSAIKRRVLTTGVGTREETFLTIHGKVRYYDLTVEPLRDRSGGVIGITCAATDITDIHVREQQLRAIFEQSLDAIAIADDEGTYIQVNSTASQLFGLPLSELLGRRITEFMEPGFDFALAWRLFREQGQLTGELRLVRPDGTVRDVEYAAKANVLPGQHLSVLRDISDRKQAEAALRDSQHLLEKIADTIPNNLYIYDLRLNTLIYANRRTEEFFGCTQTELQAMGPQFIADFLHPDDTEQISENMQRLAVARDDEVIEHKLRMKNAKGEWRLFRTWEVIFTRTADGKPEQILGVATDITDDQQTEEALRVSEKQLHAALEAAHMGTWDWNILTGQIIWSDNFAQFLGISTNGFDGNYESFIGMIHPEDRDRVLQKVERVFREKVNYEDEFRIIFPDGNVHWLGSIGQVFYDKIGKPVHMAGLNIDITDRKQVELALLQERNFISAILETANALIAVLDEQGQFVRFNRACEQITGYSFEEVKGKYIWDLFLIPEEIEPVQAVIEELQAGQFPNEHENFWVARDGSRRLISWFNTVILDIDGSVKYIVSTGIDITERQRAEEMRRALEREQALSELRLRFFSMASHEFRTPLSTILLTAQILESSAQNWSEEKRSRNLRRIVSAAKEMRQMLDDILTINRAETGRLEFAPTQIDINTFCQQLLQEMRLYTSPQHTLTFSNPSEIEEAFVDDKLLRYSLTHLLSNAIKYSPQGGEINLFLTGNRDAILFQICDGGIGISIADKPHVFEAFHRGENVDCISGSGLGLTVAKKCVELHGGSITFTSEVGVGTTFTVTIPSLLRKL